MKIKVVIIVIIACFAVVGCNLSEPLSSNSSTTTDILGSKTNDGIGIDGSGDQSEASLLQVYLIETKTPTLQKTPTTYVITNKASPSATIDVEVTKYPCKGSYENKLKVGQTVQVSNDPPLANRVRSGAGTDYTILGTIQPGETVIIIGGPECANDWIWWQVRSEKTNLVGWTSEGDWSNYWLIPVP
jgi:hypothetical protein